MANAEQNANGSQFFLTYADGLLPSRYTPFGRITSGLEVLRTIAAGGTDGSNGVGDGRPLTRAELFRVTTS